MGNLVAPGVPVLNTSNAAPSECPECHHAEPLASPEGALLSRLFGRQPKPLTCARVTVEQDALADMQDRCGCRHGWHITA